MCYKTTEIDSRHLCLFRRRQQDHLHVAGRRQALGDPSRSGSIQGRSQEGRVQDVRKGSDRRDGRLEEITVRLEPAVVARPGGKGSISRTITDIMIVIKPINDVAAHYKDRFPMQVDRNIKATLRDNKTYISEAYGRKDVFCTHPFSHSSPGIIDFSRITKDRTGSSILWVHGYPGHLGQRIVVKSEDVIINDATVHFADGWKPIEVQFRRSQVRVYP